MSVLAVLDDLLFRSKIAAAAGTRPVQFVSGTSVPAAEGPWRLILIDLNLASAHALALVRQLAQAHPSATIIGYCAHVQQALQAQALAAGCTRVLPKSAFVQQLPDLLAGS